MNNYKSGKIYKIIHNQSDINVVSIVANKRHVLITNHISSFFFIGRYKQL